MPSIAPFLVRTFQAAFEGRLPVEQTDEGKPDYITVAEAAKRMSLTANALGLRIRRRARREGRVVSAHLGGGIIAVQLGRRSWRVTFPRT